MSTNDKTSYELDEKELAFLLHNRGECRPVCKYCRLKFAYESTMSGTSGYFDDIENLIGVSWNIEI